MDIKMKNSFVRFIDTKKIVSTFFAFALLVSPFQAAFANVNNGTGPSNEEAQITQFFETILGQSDPDFDNVNLKIRKEVLPEDVIEEKHLLNNSISTNKIQDASVTLDKLGACENGQSFIYSNNQWQCADTTVFGDSSVNVKPSSGILGTGESNSPLEIDFTRVSPYLSGTCSDGKVIKGLDGANVICGSINDGDADETNELQGVITGSGLILDADNNLGLRSCSHKQFLRYSTDTGQWQCSEDENLTTAEIELMGFVRDETDPIFTNSNLNKTLTATGDGKIGIGTAIVSDKLEVKAGAIKTFSEDELRSSRILQDGGIKLYRDTTADTGNINGYIDFSSDSTGTSYGRLYYDQTQNSFIFGDNHPSNASSIRVEGKAAFGGYGVDSNYVVTTPSLYSAKGEFSELCIGSGTGDDCKNSWAQIVNSGGGIQIEEDPVFTTSNLNKKITVTSDGKVGIGTSTPEQPLHVSAVNGKKTGAIFTTNDYVSGNSGSVLLLDFGASTGNTYARLSPLSAGGLAWNNLILNQDGGNVGIGLTDPDAKLDVNGRIKTNKYLDIIRSDGNDPLVALTKTGEANAKISQKGDNGGLVISSQSADPEFRSINFATNDNSGDVSRLFISGDGNVGIGTTNPTAKLFVQGNMLLSGSSGNVGLYTTAPESGISGTHLYSPQDFSMKLYNGSNNHYFHFTNDGSFGVGNTNPTEKLDVSGSIAFSGTLKKTGAEFKCGNGQVLVGFGNDGPLCEVATQVSGGVAVWQ